MIEACEFELAAENDYYCTTHKVYFKNDSDCPYKRIAELEQQLAELREGIRKHIEEGYEPPPRGVPCSHGKHYYEDCIACGDEFLAALLQERNNVL